MSESMNQDYIKELSHYGFSDSCILNTNTGEMNFCKDKVSKGNFTGIYFKDEVTFFALYPTKLGPMIFYNNNEYVISKNLNIKIESKGKKRKFFIEQYDIEIDYIESPYIGFDVWSEEIDLDLFYMLEQRHKIDDFYRMYTVE